MESMPTVIKVGQTTEHSTMQDLLAKKVEVFHISYGGTPSMWTYAISIPNV